MNLMVLGLLMILFNPVTFIIPFTYQKNKNEPIQPQPNPIQAFTSGFEKPGRRLLG